MADASKWNEYGAGSLNEGGFMSNSQNQFSSPDAGAKKVERRAKNTVPVTIDQVLKSQDDGFTLYDKEVGMIAIIGLVKAVDVTSTKVSYIISDGTGQINAVHWLENSEGDDSSTSAPMVENTYCRIIGSPRMYQSMKNIVVLGISPVTDLNALTCHLLEVAITNIKLKSQMDMKTSGIAPGGSNAMSNSLVGIGNNMHNSSSSANVLGLSPLQDQVYAIIKQHNNDDESGPSKQFIYKRLHTKLRPNQIDEILDDLSSEGHIYSSVDDDHFRTTEG